jgi:hypothetical protein
MIQQPQKEQTYKFNCKLFVNQGEDGKEKVVMHHSFKNGKLTPETYSSDLEGKEGILTIKRNNQNFQKLDLELDVKLNYVKL